MSGKVLFQKMFFFFVLSVEMVNFKSGRTKQ